MPIAPSTHPARIVARLIALALCVLAASGCVCAKPWSIFPDTTQPDEQLSNTSGTHGFDMYIWHCEHGRRVVVAQYSSEYSCAAPRRETAACGGVTALEREVAAAPLGPIRVGQNWR